MIEPLSLQKKGDKEAGTAGRKRLAWICQAQKIFKNYDYIQIEDKDWKFGNISPRKRKELGSYGKRNHT